MSKCFVVVNDFSMNNEWRFFERRAFIFEIYELILPSISTLHSSQSDLTKEIVLINSRLDLSSNLSSGNFQTRTSQWSAAALPQSWPPPWSHPAAGSSRSPPSTRSVEGNGGSRRPQPRPSLSPGIREDLQKRGEIEAELARRAFLEEFASLIGGHTVCSGIILYSLLDGKYNKTKHCEFTSNFYFIAHPASQILSISSHFCMSVRHNHDVPPFLHCMRF